MKFPFMILMGLILIAIFGAYLASHWLIWFSLVRFFGIVTASGKTALALVILFLATSFFLTSIVTHFSNNGFTRGLYFASAAWVGLMVNLTASFIVAWLFMAIWPQGGSGRIAVGIGAIVFALAYSAWGIWNAQHPVVKHISVPVANLPEQWRGKKIVQLSDIHLGYVYREKFMADVLQKVDKEKPDAIVITGDLFDGSDGDLGWVGRSLSKLSAPRGVYFVSGNHETYLGAGEAFDIVSETDIVELHDTFADADGLQFVGVDYPLRGQSKNVADVIDGMGVDRHKPSVLLYHAPVQISQVRKTGVSLQLSGHTHVGQLFPFRLITYLVYKGYDYGLRTKGDYSVYTSSGVGTWGPPMRTGNTPEIVSITLE